MPFPNNDNFDYRRNCNEVREEMKQQDEDEKAGNMVSTGFIVVLVVIVGVILYSFRDVISGIGFH